LPLHSQQLPNRLSSAPRVGRFQLSSNFQNGVEQKEKGGAGTLIFLNKLAELNTKYEHQHQ